MFIVLDNFLMSPHIIISVYAPVEITKFHKIGLRYAVLEAGVCFEVLNGTKVKWSDKKKGITKYRSEPQYILWVALGT